VAMQFVLDGLHEAFPRALATVMRAPGAAG
jgi:hypothetical protein